MISGHATTAGTKKFAQESSAVSENFNIFEGLTLSNVGIGTYLGEPDSHTDELVKDAIKESIKSGINVVDTAINYRAQKAERSVGEAISELIDDNIITRDQIFISTKNGYVTNDAEIPGEFWNYINEEYVQKRIIKQGDISSGYHCMTVPFLEDQLDKSLKNLKMDCIDLLYLHNAVEGQKDKTREDFLKDLKAVFELYERKRGEGLIKHYGMATWDCFRATTDNSNFLSLEQVAMMAKDIGGEQHGFRFIQLPFNLYYDQAFMIKNQTVNNNILSALDAAKTLRMGVFTSVPFMQGRLLQKGVMPEFSTLKPALRALQFVRSTPGVLAPLVGQKSSAHVTENTEIMKIPKIPENEFSDLVKKMTS